MTPPSPLQRRLRSKLASFEASFADWQAESKTGKPFEKHFSQIQSVVSSMRPALASVQQEIAKLDSAAAGELDPALTVELLILELYRIWEFFRSKLLQRRLERSTLFLQAADELAWLCTTEPSRVAPSSFSARSNRPPLVFLNGTWTPYTLTRGRAFEIEMPATPDDLRTERFTRITEKLPVQVIGVPWYQLAELPGAAILAHEVGHGVDADHSIAPKLAEALDCAKSIPKARRSAWKEWLKEVFADLYGTLTFGPAFAQAVADLLSSTRKTVEEENPFSNGFGYGRYPTRTLRILLCARVLESGGHKAEASALRADWSSRYQKHALAEYEADVSPIVELLLATPVGKPQATPLRTLQTFTPQMQKDAEAAAKDLLARRSLAKRASKVLVAAARIACVDDPSGYANVEGDRRVLETILANQKKGTRDAQGPPPENAATIAARDEAAGQAILELLRAPLP